jgi:hypothetical protein
VQPVWPGAELALTLLATEGRHYTLLFSHEFARCLWRTGSHIASRCRLQPIPESTRRALSSR